MITITVSTLIQGEKMQATRLALPSSSAGILANDKPSVVGSGAGAGGGGPAAAAAAVVPTTASTRRLPNTTASLPIVYGSIALYLGKKADEAQTHEWTLFIRGPNQHDDHLSSVVISKVVFHLHPSFAQPIRELTEPPYEVTERGWGEFEAQIRIHWKDPTEQTTILNHTIKLYPQGTPAPNNSNALLQQSTEKPVLAEMYDEVVFTDPTESFFKSLTQITAVPVESEGVDDKSSKQEEDDRTSPWKKHLNVVYSDQEDFLALIGAQKFLQDELSKVKQRFQLVNDDITTVDQKLLLVQQQKQREAAAAAISGANSRANAGGATLSSDGRKRTKKARSTSQNKKSRTTSSSKTTSVPAVTISSKSTTSTSSGTNKRKTTSTTTTMSNKTTTAMTAAAVAAAAAASSYIPTTTTAATTVTATKPASTATATAAATTTTTSSNNTTSTNNKGGNSNSTDVNIQADSSNTKK